MSRSFNFNLKIYYEDTDAGGVVYYANYLKFLERARSEAIYKLGYTNTGLKKDFGVIIMVKHCNIEYKKPIFFEDNITIISKLKNIKRTSFIMYQEIKKDNELLSSADVCLVCVNLNGKPTRIPENLENLLRDFIH